MRLRGKAAAQEAVGIPLTFELSQREGMDGRWIPQSSNLLRFSRI